MQPHQHDVEDYSRKWYTMIAVAMGIFLATIDGSIVNVAMPTLEHDLRTEFVLVQWVVLAYLLTVTTLMLGIGRLADMIGKKALYSAGFVVFTIGSVLCGLSPTIFWLIGFRVIQAVGAAMVMALGPAIVTEAFPPSERGKALGITGAIVSVGIALGPTIGGFLMQTASWHWIFFVNLPVGVIGTIVALKYVPDRAPAGRQRFDYAGAVTFLVSMLSFLFALSFGQQMGFSHPTILLLFALWVVFLILFLIIEWRTPDPMVQLHLFQNRLFSVNLVTGFLTFVLISGIMFLMPFYLENVRGYDPQQVGLLLSSLPIALGITAPISGFLSDRFGTRLIVMIGLAVLLCGYVLLRTLDAQTSGMAYVLRFLPIGIGMGIFQSPNNSAVMGEAPRNQLGVASGLLALTRTLGQTTGIAVLNTIWASRAAAYAGLAVVGQGAMNTSTALPISAQVAALHDTLLVAIVVITVALLLGIWAFVEEMTKQRRSKRDVAVS